MKKIKNYKFKNLLFFSIIIISIANIKCYISQEELYDFFKDKTIDRIRQIYWNIVVDINKQNVDSIPLALSKEYAEYYIHSLSRFVLSMDLSNSFKPLNSTIFGNYLEINLFKQKLKDIELFSKLEVITIDLPKNFLINFAINIDRYERTKKRIIDGISDYINYLSKEKILEYISKKLEEYNELKNNFNEIIFNNRILGDDDCFKDNYRDANKINNFLKNKSLEELIQYIYGYENYCFNYCINLPEELISFKSYDHENIANKLEKDSDIVISVGYYIKEINEIKSLDDFMEKIEYRYFKYPVNIDQMSRTELHTNLLALEKYYNRQNNLTRSLRGLNEYTNRMEEIYQKKILKWGVNIYPELMEPGRFLDIISNEINYQYGEVKDLVLSSERTFLLRYAYNMHTFQNEIKSIYNDTLYNLYRYKNDKLYELIFSDTNLNKNLKIKSNFLNYANLHKDYFCKYIQNLERNQLKKVTKVLIELYFKEKYDIDSYQRPSEILSRKEHAMNSDTLDLIYEAENIINNTNILNQSTTIFFQLNKDFIEEYENKYFGYYNNIMDFLRSTNIYYLIRWLKKYEKITRKKTLYTNIEGGLKDNILIEEQFNKKDILELFDIYLEEYPDLFEPKKFIEIVGLNTDKTPHKYLVELFYNINENNNKEKIINITYSLTGHLQRKNLQTLFEVENFINELKYNLYNNANYTNYIYQLFRIINIFPELTNKKIFEIICINSQTRVINLYEHNYINLYYKRDKKKIAKNIQYYYNCTTAYDGKDIDQMNETELEIYISDFSKSFKENYNLQSHILDGDFYPIFYDYYENYLNNIDEEHLNFIYHNIEIKCKDNYPCLNLSDSSNLYEKKKDIINNIKKIQEFQDPKFFDKNFDYISGKDKDEFYQFLVNLTNKDLYLYTIIVNIIKIEECEKNEKIYSDNLSNLSEDIYFKIHFMSRNEMIRYILKNKEININKTLSDILPILVKYYILDIGSDNIYDLTLY